MASTSAPPAGSRPLGDAERSVLLAEMEDLVQSSALFKSLDHFKRRRLLDEGYVCSFLPGDTLMRQGDAGDAMYVVLEGTACVETTSGAESVRLADLGRGACLGEVAVITGQPRTATVTAMTEVDCAAFTKATVQSILCEDAALQARLLDLIAHRALDTAAKLSRT